jgi:hypothetical protein
MIFNTPESVLDYLPTSGASGPLDNDLQDPSSTSAGAFGGYVLAMTFNADFNDAGLLAGSADIRFGDLTILNLGVFVVDGVLEDFSHLMGCPFARFWLWPIPVSAADFAPMFIRASVLAA